ncbi:MAG: DUF2236 domain-containing protein [Bacteroidetes bacterium]|nr:DUF2236 domain-containing protein [Bacteroidota bacterium]MCB0843340.1 DUF2236 domain-containing protein [Bacteroidota bacterium]
MENLSENMRRWDDAFLDQARLRTDPLADQVIADLVQEKGLTEAKKIFDILIRNVELPLDQLPESTREYFAQTSELPSWADTQKINWAQELFLDYGPYFMVFLYYKSLPTLYACKNGVEVLVRTGRLAEDRKDIEKFTRRIAETGQFLMYSMAPGAMGKKGRAIETAQKVRLIHAAIRAFVKKEGWDADQLGEPINQEDLAITLMTFSVSLIDALPKVKMGLTDEEANAYLHNWKVIGHILGIEPALLPADIHEGRYLLKRILERQAGETEGGKIMASALIQFAKEVLPGKAFDTSPQAIMRYLAGDELTDMLGVEPKAGCLGSIAPFFMKQIIRKVERMEDSDIAPKLVLDALSRKLMMAMVRYFNNYKNRPFEVPEELAEAWDLVSVEE